MRFIGRTIKYLLRSLFSIIVFLLLVGLAKTNRDINSYISFLNSNDWSIFHWSQPATWGDPFWPTNQNSGGIADILSDDIVDVLDPNFSGANTDPAFEQDSTLMTDSSWENFWFTTSWEAVSNTETSSGKTSTAELLNVIQKSKLPQ